MTAVPALADSKVVAPPAWVMLAVMVVTVVGISMGAVLRPAPMTMTAIDGPMKLFHPREIAGRPRRMDLFRPRGLLRWFKPP